MFCFFFLFPNLKSSDPNDSDSGDTTWRQFSGLHSPSGETPGSMHRFIHGAELPSTSKPSRGASLLKIGMCCKKKYGACLYLFSQKSEHQKCSHLVSTAGLCSGVEPQLRPAQQLQLLCWRISPKAQMKTFAGAPVHIFLGWHDKIRGKIPTQTHHNFNFHSRSLVIVGFPGLPSPRLYILLVSTTTSCSSVLLGGCTTACGFTQTLTDILVPFMKRSWTVMVKETGRKKALAGIHSGPTGAQKRFTSRGKR